VPIVKGTATQLSGSGPHRYVGKLDTILFALPSMTKNTPATTPAPLPFAVNTPGTTGATVTEAVRIVAPLRMKFTVAAPLARLAGTKKFTCRGETKIIGAATVLPLLPVIEIVMSPSAVGNGWVEGWLKARIVSVEKPEPNA